MARNTDDLILRTLTHSPLTTKGSDLTADDFDNNNIAIYSDIVELSQTLGVDAYNASTTYDDTVVQFATYGNQLWQWVNASPGSAVTPVEGIYWQSVFPAILAHRKNSDTILAEGSSDEVTAAEIRAYIDGGLTTTTNLGITTKTANTFTITSSTGTDVVAPEATQTYAGLLGANDKVKLDQLSGVNTGDQTLGSLGAEATANKATDFTTVNDVLFPTIQAVETRVQEVVNLIPTEKVWKCFITQTGTSAPVITVLVNTLGAGTITPSYNSVGDYTLSGFGTSLGANTSVEHDFNIESYLDSHVVRAVTADTINILTFTSNTSANDVIFSSTPLAHTITINKYD